MGWTSVDHLSIDAVTELAVAVKIAGAKHHSSTRGSLGWNVEGESGVGLDAVQHNTSAWGDTHQHSAGVLLVR
eukprot:m.115969 g.115969  ORF g.115969 m.115969 type:complete len:73 (-) comp13116_c0_seq4:1227-1445(-)